MILSMSTEFECVPRRTPQVLLKDPNNPYLVETNLLWDELLMRVYKSALQQSSEIAVLLEWYY